MGWRTFRITYEALTAFGVTPEARGTLKRLLTYGYHAPEDGRPAYTVGEGYFPDDAVVSEPRQDPLLHVWKYDVVSDEFAPEGDGDYLLTTAYHIWEPTPTT